MQANTKPDAIILGNLMVQRSHAALDLERALERRYGAGELGEDAVPRGIRDPTSVPGYKAVGELATRGQQAQRSSLVGAHQARIALHIGGEDRRQTPLG